MLDNLIESGKKFSDKFTEDYTFTSDGIVDESKREYLRWMSKVGAYIEINYKNQSPGMSKQILEYIAKQSPYATDYNVIMGFLESLQDMKKSQDESAKVITNILKN